MFSVPEGNWLKTCLIVFCSPGRPEAEPKNGRPSESKLIWCVLVVGFFFCCCCFFLPNNGHDINSTQKLTNGKRSLKPLKSMQLEWAMELRSSLFI